MHLVILIVYNHENDDLYVHHDIILPAFPICFECIGYGVNSQNESVNYVAVGDMTKDICIWDLDLVNTLEPVAKLIGHKDSVLDLSWNQLVTQTIASGSVDHTVSLWDLNTHESVKSFSRFKSNVQSLKFHPNEAQTLLIGDCNGAVSIGDCQSGAFKKWTLENEEIEKVIWNHYNPYLCFAGTSNGSIYCFDVRNEKKFIYTFKAHNQLISGLSLR